MVAPSHVQGTGFPVVIAGDQEELHLDILERTEMDYGMVTYL